MLEKPGADRGALRSRDNTKDDWALSSDAGEARAFHARLASAGRLRAVSR